MPSEFGSTGQTPDADAERVYTGNFALVIPYGLPDAPADDDLVVLARSVWHQFTAGEDRPSLPGYVGGEIGRETNTKKPKKESDRDASMRKSSEFHRAETQRPVSDTPDQMRETADRIDARHYHDGAEDPVAKIASSRMRGAADERERRTGR